MSAAMSRDARAADVKASTERTRAAAAEREVTTDADRSAADDLAQSIDALRLKYSRQ